MKIEITKATDGMKRYGKFQNPTRGTYYAPMLEYRMDFWQYIVFGYSIRVLFKKVKL